MPEYEPSFEPVSSEADIGNPDKFDKFSDAWIDLAVQCAETDRDTFDLVLEIGSEHILLDGPLPSPLRLFLYRTLTQELKRPSKKGRSKEENQDRDFLIIQMMDNLLSQFDVPENSNPTSTNISAFAILTEALSMAGLPWITQNAVRQVWQKRHTSGRLKEWEEFQRLSREISQN